VNKAVFVDRDGVLVKTFPEGNTTRGPRTVEEIEILPSVEEALALLREADYLVVCVTNQPDLARGKLLQSVHDAISWSIMQSLPLFSTYTCPHDNDDHCGCRKPKPGLFYVAAYNHSIRLDQSYMIGDRETDCIASQRAGCHKCFLVDELPFLDIAKEIIREQT
jgi:D-glycero-D-manno-heptose 1,7-bisphosphate phosphatase